MQYIPISLPIKLSEKKLERLQTRINAILETAWEMEKTFAGELDNVHPVYKKSALNLVHYTALRSHYIEDIQQELRFMGLPGLISCEGHVMRSLLAIKPFLITWEVIPKMKNKKAPYPSGKAAR